MGVELNLEEVSFDQSINGDSLVEGLLISLSRNGEGDLAFSEVEVDRGEDGHSSLERIGG